MKNKKILRKNILGIIVFVLVVTIVLIFSLTNTNKEYKEQHTIGLIAPLSGYGSDIGVSMAQGMQLAVDEINKKGGVNGKNLNLVIQDGKLGSTSASAANYIINTQKPDILVSVFQPPSEAVAPIAKQNNIPLIYDAYVRSIKEESKLMFKANFDSKSGCKALTKFAKENNKYKKLGIVFPDIGFSRECLEGIKEIETNVEEFWFNVDEKDFKTILLKVNNKNIDRIFVVGFDYHFINIFNQLNKYNYPIKVMAATTSEVFPNAVYKDLSNEFLEDTLTIDIIDIDIDKSDFAKKYESYINKNDLAHVEYAYAAEGYDHVMLISKALENCKVRETDCIVESLENVKDHVTVNKNFGFNNRILQYTQKIYQYKNGNWVKLN
jgi:branched-chain amino acid transport system substrate-binding protein